MDFKSIYPEFLKGIKVRCLNWESNEYLYCASNSTEIYKVSGKETINVKNLAFLKNLINDILFNKWEYYYEYTDFKEIINKLHIGYKIRKPEWPNEMYVQVREVRGENVFTLIFNGDIMAIYQFDYKDCYCCKWTVFK